MRDALAAGADGVTHTRSARQWIGFCGARTRFPLKPGGPPGSGTQPGGAVVCDAMRVLRVAVDVRGGNGRREAGSCTARGTSAGGVCWEPRVRRTPVRRGLEAGHGARRHRSAVRRWLLVPCWRPQGNVFGAPEETVKSSRRAGRCARGQRHPHHLAHTVFSALALPPEHLSRERMLIDLTRAEEQ
jgi:hypothetical protein